MVFSRSFFDLFHEGNRDAFLFPELLRPYGNRVLELGCGTGRLAIPLAKAGYEVVGLDNAPAMLALLSVKEYPRENLRVVMGNALCFDLEQEFDVILLGCNFLNHFPDAKDVVKMLSCAAKHLAPHGVLIIDGSVPDICHLKGETALDITEDFPTKHGTIIRDHFQARFDPLNQLETDVIELQEYAGDRLLRSATSHETLTWYLPREIHMLCQMAGLQVTRETGALEDASCQTPISLENGCMTFYCAKESHCTDRWKPV